MAMTAEGVFEAERLLRRLQQAEEVAQRLRGGAQAKLETSGGTGTWASAWLDPDAALAAAEATAERARARLAEMGVAL